MTGLAARAPAVAPDASTVIVGAQIVAGHDGSAEMLVTVRYHNGALGQVALDEDTGLDVLRVCGAADLADLTGRSWRDILERLDNDV
jgi:hypothetical protein